MDRIQLSERGVQLRALVSMVKNLRFSQRRLRNVLPSGVLFHVSLLLGLFIFTLEMEATCSCCVYINNCE
jgi:hypothetical protein